MKHVCTLVYFCILMAAHATAQSTSAAAISFVNNDTSYDFGGVPGESAIEYQFEIKNTGSAPLSISDVKCESPNVQCKWPHKAIKPGKKGVITASYIAKGDEGSFKADVYITSNADTASRAYIHLSGAIIPAGDPYVAPAGNGAKSGRRGRGGS